MHTPSLFPTYEADRSAQPPTTRDVARRVKVGGLAALPSAIRLADNAQYQEVTCRSALNRVKGMPFQWTLNPYRGCTHGCHYCFARRYQSQLELGVGDDFSSVILVKLNFATVLRRELSRETWRRRTREERQLVAFGTATDPYQPIEGRYRLSRKTLKVLADFRTPCTLVTKGPMVVRDVDVLSELSRHAQCSVSISIPTVDEDAWARLEPGTAHPLKRLEALRRLSDAGIDAGVLMAPIVPGISSHPAKLERTISAIADHGARYIGGFVMHLDGGTRSHFMEFLERAYPHLVERYGRLYAQKRPPRRYTAQVNAVLGVLKTRYGIEQVGSPGQSP